MSRVATTAVLLLASVALAPPAGADDATPIRLADDPRVADAVRAWETWVEYQAAVDGVPGLSVGIVHDQELIAANAFGFADPDSAVRAAPETLYSICSISKLFTGVALMRERDAGALRLDDPVAEHLPWFEIRDVHPDDGPVTVRGLLTHSSGLPRESDFPYWTASESFPFPTHEQIVERLRDQETLYPASRYFQYSNLGLTLAGEIVAAKSGRPFGEYVRENVLDPLGMAATFTEVPMELRGGRLAVGHGERGRDGSREVVAPFQTRGIAPAAGFASNVPDLAKFASWQFRLLSGGREEILRPATLREMHRVHWVDPDWETTWGLAFAVSHEGDRTFVSHGGGCPGYYSHFRLEPKTKIGAIVLTNAIGSEVRLYTGKAFDLIAPAIRSALDDPDDLPERDPALDAYTGIFDSIWGQTAILRWEDGLAELWLSSRDPAEALSKLKRVEGHTFRRIRDDDEPGETVVFDVAEDGTVRRFRQHSNWFTRVQPPSRAGSTPLLPIRNARIPMEGVLSGGQPTPEEIEAAASAGFRTVINLRTEAEPGTEWEREAVEARGMSYVHIPVAGADGLTRDNAERLYRALGEAREAGPVLLHCGSGNRIGAMLALGAAWVEGRDPEEALGYGRASGLTSLEAATRAALGLDEPAAAE